MKKYTFFNLVLVVVFALSLGGLPTTPVLAQESNMAGDKINMMSGDMARAMTVPTLQVTSVAETASTVSGTGDPNKVVHVFIKNGGPERWVWPDAEGKWTAYFGPGSLVPGTEGYARQVDDAGNYTWIYWNVRTPILEIDIPNNAAYASDWLAGTDVTISFDIPGSEVEWDYSKTVTVPDGWAGCGWCQFIINIDPNEFHIQANQMVRISDGTTTRQSMIPEVIVTSVDPAADTISGLAPVGSIVNLQGPERNAIADGSGHWFADFAHPGSGPREGETSDLIPNTGFIWISSQASDYVGLKFQSGLGPFFSVFPEDARVWTGGWPLNTLLTLTIDDPATPNERDLTRTQRVHEQWIGWSVVSGVAVFENLGTIQPGFNARITDGIVAKSHIVTDVAVTGADPQADTITGNAAPGSLVEAGTCDQNGCILYRLVNTDQARPWLADLSVPGEGQNGTDIVNILPGTKCEGRQTDLDGNATVLRWRLPNEPPQIASVDAPLNPVQFGQPVPATVTFSDPDVGDLHTIAWNWGDGSTAIGSSPSADHHYAQPGVYTIGITVTDAAEESASATSHYAVIYDPSGGFVTGGGWITSPPGAYLSDPTLTSKANFGFISEYQKGANVPTGSTEFQFHVANMTFKSTSYDWLVVAGSKAQFKGLGTINSAGSYTFLLTAIDGTPDKFRIKIWDKATGAVIYDNQPGALETDLPTTALGGGSMVIHR